MFHAELRQFPRNTHAFNLSEPELRTQLLAPWLAGRPFELAGARWRPDEARLTILEGRELAPHELAMGRGWTNALKHSRDVTDALLRDAGVPPPTLPPSTPAPASGELAGLKAELLARASEEPATPQQAWQLAGRWLPSRPASERLAAAERVVGELLREGLCTLGRGTIETAADHPVPPTDVEPILLARETWSDERPALFLHATPSGAAVAGARSHSRA